MHDLKCVGKYYDQNNSADVISEFVTGILTNSFCFYKLFNVNRFGVNIFARLDKPVIFCQ